MKVTLNTNDTKIICIQVHEISENDLDDLVRIMGMVSTFYPWYYAKDWLFHGNAWLEPKNKSYNGSIKEFDRYSFLRDFKKLNKDNNE